jgi:hypothetical protein
LEEEFILAKKAAERFKIPLPNLWKAVSCLLIKTSRVGERKTVSKFDLQRLDAEKKLDEFRALKVPKEIKPLTEKEQVELEAEHHQALAKAEEESEIHCIIDDADLPGEQAKLAIDLFASGITPGNITVDPEVFTHPKNRREEK